MKAFVRYIIIGVSAAIVGSATGAVLKRNLAAEEVDYGGLDFKSLKPDCSKIVDAIDGYKGVKDLVDAFSVSDVLNYSMEKYRRAENNCSFSFGLASTIVAQDIRSCQIKNGNEYFEESVSKSKVVAVGNRMYQTGSAGEVSLFKAESSSIEILDSGAKATYPENSKSTYAGVDYAEAFGKTINEVFIYLVCEQTIKESTIAKTSDGYRIEVDLDPDLSTYFYKKQMKTISNLDKFPVFSDVKLTYFLGKSLQLNRISIIENYVATMVIDAQTKGTMDMYFYTGLDVKIPSLGESVTYIKGESK